MSNITLRLLSSLFLIVFITIYDVQAAHILGGDLSYVCNGDGTFTFTLKVARDCDDGGALFDSAPGSQTIGFITIYNDEFNEVYSINLDEPVIEHIEIDSIMGDCAQREECSELGTYTFIVNTDIVSSTSKFTISHIRCCRDEGVTNLLSSETTGTTITIDLEVPAIETCNNSPYIENPNYISVCQDTLNQVQIMLNAFDVDQDFLIYELCTPYIGASPDDPFQKVDFSPPFDSVVYANEIFSAEAPLGIMNLEIDQNTGLMTFNPSIDGDYQICIAVSDVRAGQKLSTVRFDTRIEITDCKKSPIENFEEYFIDNSQKFDFAKFPVRLPNILEELNCDHHAEFSGEELYLVLGDFPEPTTISFGYIIDDPSSVIGIGRLDECGFDCVDHFTTESSSVNFTVEPGKYFLVVDSKDGLENNSVEFFSLLNLDYQPKYQVKATCFDFYCGITNRVFLRVDKPFFTAFNAKAIFTFPDIVKSVSINNTPLSAQSNHTFLLDNFANTADYADFELELDIENSTTSDYFSFDLEISVAEDTLFSERIHTTLICEEETTTPTSSNPKFALESDYFIYDFVLIEDNLVFSINYTNDTGETVDESTMWISFNQASFLDSTLFVPFSSHPYETRIIEGSSIDLVVDFKDLNLTDVLDDESQSKLNFQFSFKLDPESVELFQEKLALVEIFHNNEQSSIFNSNIIRYRIALEEDYDNDGFPFWFDCNDLNSTIFPGAINNSCLKELLSGPTSTNEEFSILNTKLINVFPNPSNGILNIVNLSSDLPYLEIYDVNGRVVHTHQLNSNNEILNSNLQPGIYFLVASSNNQIHTEKIIVY